MAELLKAIVMMILSGYSVCEANSVAYGGGDHKASNSHVKRRVPF